MFHEEKPILDGKLRGGCRGHRTIPVVHPLKMEVAGILQKSDTSDDLQDRGQAFDRCPIGFTGKIHYCFSKWYPLRDHNLFVQSVR